MKFSLYCVRLSTLRRILSEYENYVGYTCYQARFVEINGRWGSASVAFLMADHRSSFQFWKGSIDFATGTAGQVSRRVFGSRLTSLNKRLPKPKRIFLFDCCIRANHLSNELYPPYNFTDILVLQEHHVSKIICGLFSGWDVHGADCNPLQRCFQARFAKSWWAWCAAADRPTP
ncbi:unnamed protein product [Amoebophrya sp. A120]|nr:unnamed protein product [Amoebophrya sp. A120]|eukprot:GSA120T00019118001.1